MSKITQNSKDSVDFVNNFRSLASVIAEGVIIADAEEKIIWVNKSFEKICGYTLNELIGKPPSVFQGKNTDKKTIRSIRNSLERHEVVDVELINYKPDGMEYWIRLTVTPITNSKNEIINYIAFEHDITEQKNKEIELTDSEKLYKGLFEKNPMIMYIFDSITYEFLDVNEIALKKYGYTRDEFLKMTAKDIRPMEEWKRWQKEVTKVNQNFVQHGNWRHIKKNGEEFLVEVKAVSIIYKGRQAVLTMPNDITDRLKTEEQIRKLNSELVNVNSELTKNLDASVKLNNELLVNEARLKSAQETAKLGFWESNLLEDIVYCSDELFEIFDAPKMQCPLPAELLRSRIHKDDIEKFVAASQLTRLNGTPLDLTYRLLTRTGNVKILHSKAELKYDTYSRPEKIIGITMDVTEKETTSQELKQHLNKIEIILRSITDVFYVVDKNYNFLFGNKAVEELTGLTQDKLIGKNVWKVFEDADLNLPKTEFVKALNENKPRMFEMDYNGHSFLVYVYPSEIGLAVSGKDITEKKKIDAELLDKAKFIREISDNVPGGIIQTIYYPDGRVEAPYISAGFEELWGMPIEEVTCDITKRYDAIHPDDIEEVKADISESINNLVKLDHQFRYINQKTKEIKWVRAKVVPTKREGGEVVLNGVFIDITESEKYYEEMEKSNERYEYISKAANETIWDWDIRTNVLEVGGAYKEMFGYDLPDDKTDFNFIMSIVHPDDLEDFKKEVDRGMTDYENQLRESYFRLLKKDGGTVYVYEKSYKIFDEKTKELVRIIGALQDITHLKKMEGEREKIINDLVKRNKALEQFTYIVSHNLRAPIANILGLSHLLEEKENDFITLNEIHKLIFESSLRLDEVIRDMNDILSVKRELQEEKTTVLFDDIVNEIIESDIDIIKKSNVEISYDFKKAESIISIKNYLYSIFDNLITNGIKYRRENSPFVKITSDQDDNYIYLSFEDNGVGIDLVKNSAKIFGLYNKFHLNKEGKGMGLFMVKNLVESLDGEILVESAVNEGTKFIIKLKK